jgi:hypothetical protein
MTYENAENDGRKNCPKWKMQCYTKMPKPEFSFTQKCQKKLKIFLDLERIIQGAAAKMRKK